jgi:hypothetical protein
VERRLATVLSPSQKLDFRDRLQKAPASARSYDLSEARVKKLSGTPKDSDWLFSLMDQTFKDQPRRDLSV